MAFAQLRGLDLRRSQAPQGAGAKQMTLRQFLFDNFGWDIYDWGHEEIRF
jgi:hypothetical protein